MRICLGHSAAWSLAVDCGSQRERDVNAFRSIGFGLQGPGEVFGFKEATRLGRYGAAFHDREVRLAFAAPSR